MLFNSHFSHNTAIPANYADAGAGIFDVAGLQAAAPSTPADAYFLRDGGPSLIYSVGCHSGLSATNEAFATAAFQPDFARAVLKNGGNLIGNTGYGYGDDGVAGFSERLALAFTTQIGRPGTPTLGTALALAKQRYLAESGVGGFSVYDEKVLSEWTLYGLPRPRAHLRGS